MTANSITREGADKKMYQRLEVQLFTLNAANALNKQEVDEPDYATVAHRIADRSYLKICDFDDHFDCVNNDWRNPGLV